MFNLFISCLTLFFIQLVFPSVLQSETKTATGIALQKTVYVYEDKDKNSNSLKGYQKGSILVFQINDSEDWYNAVVYVDGERKEGFIHKNDVEVVTESPENLSGYAVKKAKVYQLPSSDSKVWKSYSSGKLLYYQTFTSEWYQAIVYVNGERKKGFIPVSDVEQPVTDQISKSGYAKEDQTRVYANPNKNSQVLKSYESGKKLYYKTFLSDWYEAVVYVNGQRKIGYIAASDVEEPDSEQKSLSGVALKNRTNVYVVPNNKSNVLKSYPAGKTLYYKTFLTNWYEAIVYVNGERKTGYIHAEDVESPTKNPVQLSGIAVKRPTNVYAKPSSQSKVLKSYGEGNTLYFQTHVTGWYKALVYINGKPYTGFIQATDVEIPTDQSVNLSGIAYNSKTKVYSKPTQESQVLKSYNQGRTLYYKTFISNWYEALVYINGKLTIGYIYKDDVISPDEQRDLKGVVYGSRAHVYSKPNTKSSILKSYKHGSILRFKTFTTDWYEAIVYVNGKRNVGYIHKKDVDLIDVRDKIIKGVPVLNQFPSWPTGCESVSVTMLLAWAGYNISVSDVVDVLPKGPAPYWYAGKMYGANPDEEFVGHPASKYSFGAYQKPMLRVIDKIAKNGGKDLTGMSFEKQLEVVKSGKPVVMWTTINLLPSYESYTWYDRKKNKVTWIAREHAFVVVGVSNNYVIVHDPYIGKRIVYNKQLVKKRWNEMGGRAITIN